MKSTKLIGLIDQEIDLCINEGTKLNVEDIVNSYEINEKQKDVVKDYVSEIRNLLSRKAEKLEEESEKIGQGIFMLGLGISASIGAGIGAVIGYFADGTPSGVIEYSLTAATLGFFTEIILHPASYILAYGYANSLVGSCEKPRALSREKTLLKLGPQTKLIE